MVALRFLVPSVGVRIPVSLPFKASRSAGRFFCLRVAKDGGQRWRAATTMYELRGQSKSSRLPLIAGVSGNAGAMHSVCSHPTS